AVSGRFEALDDAGYLIQVGEIERDIGTDREPDAVRRQGYAADQTENFLPLRPAAVDVVIDRDFEHIEARQVRPRPRGDGRAVAEPNQDACAAFTARISPQHHTFSDRWDSQLAG